MTYFVIAFVVSGSINISQYTGPEMNQLYMTARDCEEARLRLYPGRDNAVCVATTQGPSR